MSASNSDNENEQLGPVAHVDRRLLRKTVASLSQERDAIITALALQPSCQIMRRDDERRPPRRSARSIVV